MKLNPILIAICSTTLLFAQDNKAISLDDNSFDNSLKGIEEEYSEIEKAIDEEYAALESEIEEEYRLFESYINSKWGEGEHNTNQQYVWVEYNDNYNSRSIVDYENETADIELLVTDQELKDTVAVRERLAKAVATLLESHGRSVDYNSEIIPKTSVLSVPIMDGVVDLSSYGIKADSSMASSFKTSEVLAEERAKNSADSMLHEQIAQIKEPLPVVVEQIPIASSAASPAQGANSSSSDVGQIADAITRQEPISVSRKQTKNGTINIVKISPKLVGNYKYNKAKQFEPIVDKYALKYGIDKSLIFGIIETESMFNPTASSIVPAHGLMQIVPRTAGIDSYNYVYGQRRLVTQSYLYNPEKNIELGVAYLKILKSKWFHRVADPKCQELCMIAAYNTGMGNVGKAFTGTYNVSRAIPQINALSYNGLYRHLTTRLHHKEAREYVVKVTTKRVKYLGLQ